MKNELNCLVVSRFRPDVLNGGAAIRNGQNIFGLSRLGRVDVLTIGLREVAKSAPFVESWENIPLNPTTRSRNLLNLITLNHKIFFSGYYPALAYYNSSDVIDWIGERKKNGKIYDVIVVEEISLTAYLPLLKSIGKKVIFDDHNVEAILRSETSNVNSEKGFVRGLFTAIKNRALDKNLIAVEQKAVSISDAIWCCSDLDKDALSVNYGANNYIYIVPNAIELKRYAGDNQRLEDEDWSSEPLNVVYMGSYSYLPNSHAAMELIYEIFPIILKLIKSAKLYLVGRDPTHEMLLAAKQSDNIVVTGAVESVQPYLDMPSVMAMPIRYGSGTRLKILESFAARRPIVTTKKGAEGIGAKDFKNILIRETPNEIAEATFLVWKDQKLRSELCENAYRLVSEYYSWEVAAGYIEKSVSRLLA